MEVANLSAPVVYNPESVRAKHRNLLAVVAGSSERGHLLDYARVKYQVAANRIASTIHTTARVARLDFVAGCSDSNIFPSFV